MERLELGAGFLERGQAAADADHTEAALQADAALTLEQRTLDAAGALLDGAGVRLVANLKLEQGLQAIAQFFSTFEPQRVVGAFADSERLVGALDEACVNRTVDLNRRLSLCNTGESAEECQSQK